MTTNITDTTGNEALLEIKDTLKKKLESDYGTSDEMFRPRVTFLGEYKPSEEIPEESWLEAVNKDIDSTDNKTLKTTCVHFTYKGTDYTAIAMVLAINTTEANAAIDPTIRYTCRDYYFVYEILDYTHKSLIKPKLAQLMAYLKVGSTHEDTKGEDFDAMIHNNKEKDALNVWMWTRGNDIDASVWFEESWAPEKSEFFKD